MNDFPTNLTAAFLNHAERLTQAHDAAHILCEMAWRETDHIGDLVPYSQYYRQHIASSIDAAAEIYTDRFGASPTDAEMKRARLLLELETDALIEKRDRARDDAVADEIDAGDRDARGELVEWEGYR